MLGRFCPHGKRHNDNDDDVGAVKKISSKIICSSFKNRKLDAIKFSKWNKITNTKNHIYLTEISKCIKNHLPSASKNNYSASNINNRNRSAMTQGFMVVKESGKYSVIQPQKNIKKRISDHRCTR